MTNCAETLVFLKDYLVMELQFIILARVLVLLFSIPAGANIISREMNHTIVELTFLQISPHSLPLVPCPPPLFTSCPEIIIKGVKLLRPRGGWDGI